MLFCVPGVVSEPSQLHGMQDHGVSTPKQLVARNLGLVGLHIGFAVFFVLASIVALGGVPGFSSDDIAALGFLLFFGFGVPLLVIALGTLLLTVLVREWWLAAALVGTGFLSVSNVWLGLVASLTYLWFTVSAFARRRRWDVKRASHDRDESA